jgi:uncharacterized integral membrane protein
MRLRGRAGKVDEDYQPRLWLTLLLLGLLLAYVLYFVAANDEQVSVEFLFFDATLGLIWVILLSVAIGLAAGLLLSQLYRRRSATRSSASKPTPSATRSGDS